jgi:uncharacterized membrane protein YgcG
MSTVGFETRAIRARKVTARIYPGLPLLVAAMLAVFACFFAVGRATDTSSPRTEALSSLPTAFHSTAIPIHLGSALPIAISSVVSTHHRSTRRNQSISAPAVSAPAQTVVHDVPVAPPRPSVQPVSPPAEQAPPSPASASPAPASASPPSTGGSSGSEGGHSKPSASGGGSFDSSG